MSFSIFFSDVAKDHDDLRVLHRLMMAIKLYSSRSEPPPRVIITTSDELPADSFGQPQVDGAYGYRAIAVQYYIDRMAEELAIPKQLLPTVIPGALTTSYDLGLAFEGRLLGNERDPITVTVKVMPDKQLSYTAYNKNTGKKVDIQQVHNIQKLAEQPLSAAEFFKLNWQVQHRPGEIPQLCYEVAGRPQQQTCEYVDRISGSKGNTLVQFHASLKAQGKTYGSSLRILDSAVSHGWLSLFHYHLHRRFQAGDTITLANIASLNACCQLLQQGYLEVRDGRLFFANGDAPISLRIVNMGFNDPAKLKDKYAERAYNIRSSDTQTYAQQLAQLAQYAEVNVVSGLTRTLIKFEEKGGMLDGDALTRMMLYADYLLTPSVALATHEFLKRFKYRAFWDHDVVTEMVIRLMQADFEGSEEFLKLDLPPLTLSDLLECEENRVFLDNDAQIKLATGEQPAAFVMKYGKRIDTQLFAVLQIYERMCLLERLCPSLEAAEREFIIGAKFSAKNYILAQHTLNQYGAQREVQLKRDAAWDSLVIQQFVRELVFNADATLTSGKVNSPPGSMRAKQARAFLQEFLKSSSMATGKLPDQGILLQLLRLAKEKANSLDRAMWEQARVLLRLCQLYHDVTAGNNRFAEERKQAIAEPLKRYFQALAVKDREFRIDVAKFQQYQQAARAYLAGDGALPQDPLCNDTHAPLEPILV